FHLGLWAAPRAWGYGPASAGVGVELRGQLSALWPGGFVVLRAGANGVFTAGVPDSGRVSGGLTVASQNLPKQTLVLHLEGAGLSRVGSDVGLALRFGPTRAVRGDVAEFAVGYRFGEGFSGSRWGFAIRKGVTY